jgi:hypothetical protein
MAKRSRSEILQGQARASERRGAQQVNGYFPFRLNSTQQQSDDFHHNRKTGLSATQNLKNAENLRAKAWSHEVDNNPKLKGSSPFEKRTLLAKAESKETEKRLANRSELDKEFDNADYQGFKQKHNLDTKGAIERTLKVRNSSIPLAPTQFND